MTARAENGAEGWTKDGGQAFPTPGSIDYHYVPGMTLRDYMAIHADQPGAAEIVTAAGLVFSGSGVWSDSKTMIGSFADWWRDVPQAERFRLSAVVRYAMADALLLARGGAK